MWYSIAQLLVGLVILIGGADRFIVGAAEIARSMRLPSLVVGMLLIGFGTSLPELMVSVTAAWRHASMLSVGNAIGSNIANVGFVMGVAALLFPLRLQSRVLRWEFPWLIILSFLVLWMMRNAELTRVDGIILLLLLLANIAWLFFWVSRQRQQDQLKNEFQESIPASIPISRAWIYSILGMICLLFGSNVAVSGAVSIAQALGISQLTIGLTVVAVGTSLPELAACIISVMRGEHDMAVGNIVGSGIFNLCGVLAAPALLSPGPVSPLLFSRDVPVMCLLAVLMWLMGLLPPRKGFLGRGSGVLFLMVFIVYLCAVLFKKWFI